MRYYPKLEIYKAPNVEFCPKSKIATSYEWYWLTRELNGKLILNDYPYSSTTIRHAAKVRYLLNELNIDIDMRIEAPAGLQNIDRAIEHYKNMIECNCKRIAKPRTWKKTILFLIEENSKHCDIIRFLEGCK